MAPGPRPCSYTFTGGSDGDGPNGSLVFDTSGALYGTTEAGGDLSCNGGGGCGTVFKLTPPATPGGAWKFTLLHTFTGGSDGGFPNGGLIFDASGTLYGTTDSTVFELTLPITAGAVWTETVLYRFSGSSDGGEPNGGLIFDVSGALYGTTQYGGDSGCTVTDGGCGTDVQANSARHLWRRLENNRAAHLHWRQRRRYSCSRPDLRHLGRALRHGIRWWQLPRFRRLRHRVQAGPANDRGWRLDRDHAAQIHRRQRRRGSCAA